MIESHEDRALTIRSVRIADDTGPYCIAEIGHNHQGSVETAKLLIDYAAEAGFQAVKFQKRDVGNFELYSEQYAEPYVNENSFGATYGEHREALELGWDDYCELRDYARAEGLAFGATAFDIPSLLFLGQVGVDFYKLASGSICNDKLLRSVANALEPVILSTGGATDCEVENAAAFFDRATIAILQCTSLYPCPPDKANLRVIESYREQFPSTVIGFSDHVDDAGTVAVMAYTLGARIFEKHVTYSHTARGSDHAMSLEPEGQRRYVQALRNAPLALGDGSKVRYPEEIPAVIKQGRRDLIGAEN